MVPPAPEVVSRIPLWVCFLAAAMLCSAAIAAWMVRHAHRRGLLDHPGRRRLHRIPTPRGGGIGFVLALLAGLPLLPRLGVPMPVRWLAAWWIAVLIVALLGARDDRRGLGVAPRLAGHLLAGCFLAASVWPQIHATLAAPWSEGAAALIVLATAWSINLHNFMDGSDGLLGMHALLVGLGLAILGWQAQMPSLWGPALLVSASVAGFLPLNLPLPRARIFMGDVGSGVLGCVVAALSLAGVASHAWPVPSVLLLVSGFLVDASATLLWRMAHGRRWWRPHREHLYQWLARTRRGHGWPLAAYAAWDVLVALPLAWLAQRHGGLGWWLVAMVYMLAGAFWWQGKRACRRVLRRQRIRHAPV